jgi:hypothetical protein
MSQRSAHFTSFGSFLRALLFSALLQPVPIFVGIIRSHQFSLIEAIEQSFCYQKATIHHRQ